MGRLLVRLEIHKGFGVKTVQILEADDLITKDCWMRPLRLETMSGGMSDSMSFKSCYSGTPENNVKWVRVIDQIGPRWIGKEVREFNGPFNTPYEFIIGDPPKSHQLNMSGYLSMRRYHV